MSSSRAPAPPPLYIDKMSRTPASPLTMSPDSMDSAQPSYMSPRHNRKSSSGSSDSGYTSSSYNLGSRKPSSPRNIYTHCGRHTDQYLFGGKGFGDMWRAITKKE